MIITTIIILRTTKTTRRVEKEAMTLFCDVHAGTSCVCVPFSRFVVAGVRRAFFRFQNRSFYGSVRVHFLLYEPPKYNFCRRSMMTLHIGHRRNRLQHFLHVHAWPHGINTAWTGASRHKAHSENFLPLALRMREACGSSRSATSAPSFASSASSSPSPSPPSSSPLSEADINP